MPHVSQRRTASSPSPQGVARGNQRETIVERIDLGPLDQGQIAEQVSGIVGERPNETVMALISERSDGNPLFTEELVAASMSDVERGLSPTLVELLVTRVEALSEETQQIMRVASVAGRGVPHALLAEVGGFARDELTEPLREAVEHHVLVADRATSSYTFRHALVREVVYDQLLPEERSVIHEAYARALSSSSGTPAAELAYHWYQAHELPSALSASIEAGLEAERTYAFPEALQHFERALELWNRVPEAEDLTSLDLSSTQKRAAYAAFQAGDPARAASLMERAVKGAAASGDRIREGTLRFELGRIQRWGLGDDEAALENQQRSVDLLATGETSADAVRSLAELAVGFGLVGRFDEARETAGRALALAEEIGDLGCLGYAHGAMGLALIKFPDLEDAEVHLLEAMRFGEEVGDAEVLGSAYINLSYVLHLRGRFAEAAEKALEGAALMGRFGHEYTDGHFLLGNACESYFYLGRWDDVERLTSEMLTPMAENTGNEVNEVFALSMRSSVRTMRGDLERGRHDAESGLRLSGVIKQQPFVTGILEAMAQSALTEGRYEDASVTARECLELSLDGSAHWDAARACFLGLQAEAELAQLARARKDPAALEESMARGRELIEQSESLAAGPTSGAMPGYASLSRGEMARLSGASDPDLWSDSARIWGEIECPYEVAYASWRLGEALLNSRSDRQRAGEALRTAHDLSRRLGAKPLAYEIEALARRARIDLAAPVEATPRPSEEDRLGLTPRELEVLELVAAGKTNPQIAEELFISRKTVGIHVSHILAKLGVSGRVEAATRAQRLGLIGDQEPSADSITER